MKISKLEKFQSSPHLSSSRSVAHKAALLFFHLSLSLARALASSQDFQPPCHCPLFLHSTEPGGFGAADFSFAHRCPGKCCGAVVFSGHPKNMSQKSPSPSLYFYTDPRTSCSFVKLINRYYVRPKYTQASFKALVLEGIWLSVVLDIGLPYLTSIQQDWLD